MRSEVQSRAEFSTLRYAQCWEDADVLLEALAIQPHHTCLSIASAGDNALSMLSRGPRHVLALDLSESQLASVELRIAAYRELNDEELLRLMGSRSERNRRRLYRRCRSVLSPKARRYWDAREAEIDQGIGALGKLERYFETFRRQVLPLVHGRATVDRLFEPKSRDERREFYDQTWNTWRWRKMFRLFFSRRVMARAGRDPAFFEYVEGNVADRILARAEHALCELDPSRNPYLHWIFRGAHGRALPHALRPENQATIRAHLDCLEWRQQSLEDFLRSNDAHGVHAYNLSDVFEYVSPGHYHRTLETIADTAAPAARLAYWNLLVPRSRPGALADRLRPLPIAEELHRRDKSFFYEDFVVEEVQRR